MYLNSNSVIIDKKVWNAKIGKSGKYGNVFRPTGQRGTPTAYGEYIYILGQHGDLVCFTTAGKEVWRVDYLKDHNGINMVWAFSESPLVDGNQLICTPGAAEATLVALEKKIGKLLWKYAMPDGKTGNRDFYGKSGSAYSSVTVPMSHKTI